MTWPQALFIALTANLDNLGVGIAYGARKIKVSWQANLVIAFLSFLSTWLAEELGLVLQEYISFTAASFCGALLIILVGLWILIGSIFTREEDRQAIGSQLPGAIISRPERADRNYSQDIDLKEACVLGVALSVNALAIGLDAGLVLLSSLLMPCLVALFSFGTLIVGCYLGRVYVAETLGKKATIVSAILLLLLGAHQLWQ